MIIGKMGGLPDPGMIWPRKWDGLAMRDKWLPSQGLNGRPRKFLAEIMSEFQIAKKSMD